jgi:ribose 5-phosphate isomerase B
VSIQEAQVRELVRNVLRRTLGLSRPSTAPRTGIVTERSVAEVPTGGTLQVASGSLITPLARDTALERGVTIVEGRAAQALARSIDPALAAKTIAIGADHGGYELKQALQAYLKELGYAPLDCGTFSTDSVDYPDFALAVAELVANGRAWRGIVIDGAGIGSCMTANKVPGVRAAMCYDQATALNSREHNDANVLTLGAGLIGPALARQIVKTWLETAFGGGRHARRVAKIEAIEKRFLKS